MFGKKKLSLLETDINYALHFYYKNVHGVELGKISYEVNKSTGRVIGAKAQVLKNIKD